MKVGVILGLLKFLGQLMMMNAKTPGDLATGAILVAQENEKENNKKLSQATVEERVIEWSQCSECGSEVKSGDAFCPICGIEFKRFIPRNLNKTHNNFVFYDENGKIIEINKLNVYKSGFYKAGSLKLPTGNYMFFSNNSNGYFSVSSGEISKDEILENRDDDSYCTNNIFIRLNKNDIIYFENGLLVNTNEFKKVNFENAIGISTYRVGIDIPVGNYKLYPINSDYYASYSVSYEFFGIGNEFSRIRVDDEKIISLKEGMVLFLFENCKFDRL